MNNIDREFFEKVKGWEYHPQTETTFSWWEQTAGFRRLSPPKVATSWDAFQKWVVPELMKKVSNDKQWSYYKHTIGIFFCDNETPEEALKWAMEELGKGGEE